VLLLHQTAFFLALLIIPICLQESKALSINLFYLRNLFIFLAGSLGLSGFKFNAARSEFFY
jgi:hypothetical protein